MRAIRAGCCSAARRDDPFGGRPLTCVPDGRDSRLRLPPTGRSAAEPRGAVDAHLIDQQTAAVARVAAARGVPFLRRRAVSDNGDFAQFFAYYGLAARNAAIVTRALLDSIEGLATSRSGRRACRLLAKRSWERAAENVR